MADASRELIPPRVPVEAFIIPDRTAFLRSLDLTVPSLVSVKCALDSGDEDSAAAAYIKHFRQVALITPLLSQRSHEEVIFKDTEGTG